MPSSGRWRRFGGTSVHTRSTRRHIPEDGILHSHLYENLNSYKLVFIFVVWSMLLFFGVNADKSSNFEAMRKYKYLHLLPLISRTKTQNWHLFFSHLSIQFFRSDYGDRGKLSLLKINKLVKLSNDIFERSNPEIVSSNPTRGIMSVCIYSVCVVLCRWRPCDGLIPRPRSPIVCL
jgi:hypothetical protein